MKPRNDLDPSVAFSILLKLDAEFADSPVDDGTALRTFLDAWYADDSTNMFEFGERWVAAKRDITILVTTHRRGDGINGGVIYEVFVRVGADPATFVGTIKQTGARDWETNGLVYGTKAGAAHDIARRAVKAGRTPYVHDYRSVTYETPKGD